MFYGFGEILSNVVSIIYTKIVWGRDKKLIRLPFRARNRNNIEINSNFTCGYGCRLTAGADNKKIIIGKDCTMGDYCQIEGNGGVYIGNNVLIASKVFISSNSHGIYKEMDEFDIDEDSNLKQSDPTIPPRERFVVKKSVIIGDNVWIGNGAMILMGVTIGKGAIVGAGAVVAGDVPEDSIVVGCPARVIKQYDYTLSKWARLNK